MVHLLQNIYVNFLLHIFFIFIFRSAHAQVCLYSNRRVCAIKQACFIESRVGNLRIFGYRCMRQRVGEHCTY